MNNYNSTKCEALINGVRIEFDAQHEGDLKEAKQSYRHAFKYIGSTTERWYNGIKSTSDAVSHIFIYK